MFEQLGVYRILAEVEDPNTVDRFVREWLGADASFNLQLTTRAWQTLGALGQGGAKEPARVG